MTGSKGAIGAPGDQGDDGKEGPAGVPGPKGPKVRYFIFACCFYYLIWLFIGTTWTFRCSWR